MELNGFAFGAVVVVALVIASIVKTLADYRTTLHRHEMEFKIRQGKIQQIRSVKDPDKRV